MKIFRQIVKEFWLPLTIATLWAGYNYLKTPAGSKQITLLVNMFGATFFFFSWLTAQYFRVKKQCKVEDVISSTEEKSKEILRSIENEVLKFQQTTIDMLERIAFNAVKDRIGLSNYETLPPIENEIPSDPDTPRITYLCVSPYDSYSGEIKVLFRVVDEGLNFDGHKSEQLTISTGYDWANHKFYAEKHEYGFYTSILSLPESSNAQIHNLKFTLIDNSGNKHIQAINVTVGSDHR